MADRLHSGDEEACQDGLDAKGLKNQIFSLQSKEVLKFNVYVVHRLIINLCLELFVSFITSAIV